MSKKLGGIGRPSNLVNTQQSDCWKEILRTEKKSQKKAISERIKELESYLEDEGYSTFLSLAKTGQRKQKEEEEKLTKSELAYDISKMEETNNYCQKCKRDSSWCPHKLKRDDPKGAHIKPTTRSQEYGWHMPIDTIVIGKQKNSVCERTFNNPGHL